LLSSLCKWTGCLLLVVVLGCSCIWRREPIQGIPVQEAIEQVSEPVSALAEEWLLSSVSEALQDILSERMVHIAADVQLSTYREAWGEETPHVDVSYSDYVVRLPLKEIAGYPWQAAIEQLETGIFGPLELGNGWLVWLGDVERADAISHDLSIAVRDTCNQLSASGDQQRDRALRRLCDDFRKGFVFENDFELYRRLWHSSFEVEEPARLGVNEALTTLFLADLKRLIAPPTAEEHVAEVHTRWMRGFEFGDETSLEGFSAELFDDRNRVTVLFLPPEQPGEQLDEEFRRNVLASVRRHGRWVLGLDMIRKAEEILKMEGLENSKAVAMLLLFSSLQFPDHKTRAARMLLKLLPLDAPEREKLIGILNEKRP